MLSWHIDIPPWFVFIVVLIHRYPSLICLQCCLDTYIPPWLTTLKTNQGGISVSRQHWSQIREGYLCVKTTLKTNHIDIPPWFVFNVVFTQISLPDLSSMLSWHIDIPPWGYLCIKKTMKTNQGGIYMCQDNIEDKSGRDIYVSRQQWRQIREEYLCVKTTLKVLTHRYPSLICLHCCLDT
jgi:hypothetical protein